MDLSTIKAIIAALDGTDVSRLEWTNAGETIVIERQAAPVAAPAPQVITVPAPAPTAAPAPSPAPAPAAATPAPAASATAFTVASPFVGTFYRAASPEKPTFVELGAVVQKGQVLCIVEAMKLMNEIEAERAGRVVEILVENGQAVEYGEPLFKLEPV